MIKQFYNFKEFIRPLGLTLKDEKARRPFIMAMLAQGILLILSLSLPVLFKKLISDLQLPRHALGLQVFLLLLIYVTLWTFSQILEQIREILATKIFEKTIKVIILSHYFSLFDKTRKLKQPSKESSGEFLNYFYMLKENYAHFISAFIFFIIPLMLEIVGSSGILFYFYGLIYALIFILVSLVFFLLTFLLIKNYLGLYQENVEASERVSNFFVERIQNFETLCFSKSRHSEMEEVNNFLSQSEEAERKSKTYYYKLRVIQNVILGVGLGLLSITSVIHLKYYQYDISDFLMINSYLLQLLIPLAALGVIMTDIYKGKAAIKKLFSSKKLLLDSPNEESSCFSIETIHFHNVCFGYEEGKGILENITFEISKDQIVGILGPSGSGKSTLAKLIANWYAPNKGEVLINKEGIDPFKSSLYKSIYLLPQKIDIFHESIQYNICFGKKEVSSNELEKTLYASCFDEVVDKLPQRMDTPIGDKSSFLLSGGEQRRLGIARALIAKPEWLILDETMAFLDAHKEKIIYDRIRSSYPQMGIIIISHNNRSIDNMQHLIWLEKGKVVKVDNKPLRAGLDFLDWSCP